MKKNYYICDKCIDNREIERYTIGIIGPEACEICRKEFEPENISCVSLANYLKITIANKHLKENPNESTNVL